MPTHTLAQVRTGWGTWRQATRPATWLRSAGRVVFIRNTGKLCFATLQDGFTADDSGERLQAMLSLAEVGVDALAAWKADVDLGDFVWVRGRVIASRRGELSIMVSDWRLASKALRPLPTLHKELSEESRFGAGTPTSSCGPRRVTWCASGPRITRAIRAKSCTSRGSSRSRP